MTIFIKSMLSAAVLALATSCEDRDAETADPSEEPTVTQSLERGQVTAAGAMMNWARTDESLAYKLLYEAPSACYSAGEVNVVTTPSNEVQIVAEIVFADNICAQTITVISFEGTVQDVTGPFVVTGTFKDLRSGREITLSSIER